MERITSDLDGIDSDAARSRQPNPTKSQVFFDGYCPDPRCPKQTTGTCARCGLRISLYPETKRLLALKTELDAGIPLERDQLGYYELRSLAMIRKREDVARAVSSAMGGK